MDVELFNWILNVHLIYFMAIIVLQKKEKVSYGCLILHLDA